MYFKSEPKWQKELIRELAAKYGIDIRIVRTMVYYPYIFSKNIMEDIDDETPIRHRFFGAFNIKNMYRKSENETKVE